MKIAISSGHGKYIRGARGNPVPPQVDEVDEARRMVDRVAELLSCPKFHDNTSHDQSTNLHTIVAWHDKQNRELDVSVHLNCYDHSAYGTEVLYVTQSSLAAQVSAAICEAGGFTNRGAKYRSDLYFLNNTDKPAILLEVLFCDNTGDCNKYHDNFEDICTAIAESISGQQIGDQPPVEPPGWEPPERPERPPVTEPAPATGTVHGLDAGDTLNIRAEASASSPAIGAAENGDSFPIVAEAWNGETHWLRIQIGTQTGSSVAAFGWVSADYVRVEGDITPPGYWTLNAREIDDICGIALASEIASYSWQDRGQAPEGYVQGMALAFATTYKKFHVGHPAAVAMAQARKDSDQDALNVYRSQYNSLGMSNESSGPDTLRHLYALMLGHGMRESSGQHCEGRDQSASNVESDTAEAGLFQTSYNAHSACDPEFDNLMAEYTSDKSCCYLDQFAEDVSCSSSDWDNYGSGDGEAFQALCKSCPAFAVETCGLTLRSLCNHYGPIIRGESELHKNSDVMFQSVQNYIDGAVTVAMKVAHKKPAPAKGKKTKRRAA